MNWTSTVEKRVAKRYTLSYIHVIIIVLRYITKNFGRRQLKGQRSKDRRPFSWSSLNSFPLLWMLLLDMRLIRDLTSSLRKAEKSSASIPQRMHGKRRYVRPLDI